MKKFILPAFVLIALVFKVDAQTFNDGLKDGKKATKKIFKSNGGCSNIWSLSNDADKQLTRGTFKTDNKRDAPRTKLYKEGGRAGVKEQVKELEKQCLQNPDECILLGESAAQALAYEYCGQAKGYAYQNYKKTCREIAINTCKGSINTEIYNTCQKSPSSSELLKWQKKCTHKIDDLIGPQTLMRGGIYHIMQAIEAE